MLCPCSFNESLLYTRSPKCKHCVYIRALRFGRTFGLVYRGDYIRGDYIRGGLYSGFYGMQKTEKSRKCVAFT